MPVKFELMRDGHVMYYTISDPLTLDELAQMMVNQEPFFETKMDEGQVIHAIVDARCLNHLPMHTLSYLFQRTNLPQRMNQAPVGQMYVVAYATGIRVAVSISQTLLNNRLYLVNSLEEAWQRVDQLLSYGHKPSASSGANRDRELQNPLIEP